VLCSTDVPQQCYRRWADCDETATVRGMAERIPVDRLVDVRWHREWVSPRATARLGETGDGRWVAWHSGRGDAYAHWFERAACEQLQRWIGRGAWRELAATVDE
jgi:hypothetical protein